MTLLIAAYKLSYFKLDSVRISYVFTVKKIKKFEKANFFLDLKNVQINEVKFLCLNKCIFINLNLSTN